MVSLPPSFERERENILTGPQATPTLGLSYIIGAEARQSVPVATTQNSFEIRSR